MRKLGIVLAGMLTSALASSLLTACCPDRPPRVVFKLPSGNYGLSSPTGDTNYRLFLSEDGVTVVELFERGGKSYRQEYRVIDRQQN
ncbi:hypothetical protein D7X55_01925 [Corallococcus sp. AB049A]|uniref:Uncharacterized protein n=1 Tax=Corallococcus interemptor TaxID=2316720 RepID=A0A3A8QX10_9BACT|nr:MULTISPECIES: hypothetical protein [Corallococcus]RKH73319.1 hypothetical protein D7X96_02665 [Corallococcus interemptor]RKI74582.1 hypothetical protein D7X55_01925 [Corallococcus sp. AB049A]